MEPIITVIAFSVFLIYAGLILYYRRSWLSIVDFKLTTSDWKPITRISVIIPARNEAQNMGSCLQSLIKQSYPGELFEVLVVDDHSTDDTAAIVTSFNVSNIKLLALKDLVAVNGFNSYKKKAIEIAITRSTGELIVTTDADCIVPPTWLQTIAAFYEEKKPSFIVMPVAIHRSNKFIEIFQALDFMTLQGITGASVNKKFHSMCNGANLAYTKKVFIAVDGFAGIDTIASGDDMLLMHKIFKQDPAGVLFLRSKEVIVQTQPVNSIKDFFSQRIRWASKADHYDDKRIFGVLLIVYLFNLLLLALPVISIFSNNKFSIHIYPVTVVGALMDWWLFLLITKTIIELFFLYPVAKFFNKRKLLWLFPLMQPFHILYTVIAGWLGKFGSYKWKGRNVK
jgi:cellulose synthase/poly-beta-1,6-N-acetylglucosamine synthase-like glycosyltransferase